MIDIKEGAVYEVKFPFVLYSREVYDIGSGYSYPDESWKPGCNQVFLPPDDFEFVADGEGKMFLTVVSVHKPGKYPERVFYTREWVAPDGEVFGKTKLQMTTTATFRRRASGYYHKYRVDGE